MRISDWSSDVCSSDLLFEQRLRLPCLESPIHESDRFPDTAIITIKPRQDHDKPATILFSRTSETIARFCGMPRLQPVSSCNLPRKGIAVPLSDCRPIHGLIGKARGREGGCRDV